MAAEIDSVQLTFEELFELYDMTFEAETKMKLLLFTDFQDADDERVIEMLVNADHEEMVQLLMDLYLAVHPDGLQLSCEALEGLMGFVSEAQMDFLVQRLPQVLHPREIYALYGVIEDAVFSRHLYRAIQAFPDEATEEMLHVCYTELSESEMDEIAAIIPLTEAIQTGFLVYGADAFSDEGRNILLARLVSQASINLQIIGVLLDACMDLDESLVDLAWQAGHVKAVEMIEAALRENGQIDDLDDMDEFEDEEASEDEYAWDEMIAIAAVEAEQVKREGGTGIAALAAALFQTRKKAEDDTQKPFSFGEKYWEGDESEEARDFIRRKRRRERVENDACENEWEPPER